jgi:hypothetical protein
MIWVPPFMETQNWECEIGLPISILLLSINKSGDFTDETCQPVEPQAEKYGTHFKSSSQLDWE